MDIFGGIEKLITEHGSAAILRERIALIAQQYSALEKENATLKQQVASLESEKTQIKNQLEKLAISGNPDGYVCDHCGSPSLKRTGNRPDPTFGRLGVKQAVFVCNSCSKESAFTP